jgi:hypothetical protein
LKGVVFTELMEMVESKFSLAMVDAVVARAGLAGRSYTAVGTYPVEEVVAFVVALSEETKTPVPDLLFAFGRHLLGRFAATYPAFFADAAGPIAFLGRVDAYIHVEVKKLYPDAELPRFDVASQTERSIELVYHSKRRFADLAHGLIVGCGEHWGVDLDVAREDLSEGRGEDVKFTVTTR